MRDNKVKLIYFSLERSEVKQIEISWRKFYSLLVISFIILLFLVSASIALFTDFYHNVKIASLSKINNLLKTQLAEIKNEVSQVEELVKDLEEEDDDLRILADLPAIDSDTRDVGVGGIVEINYELPLISNEIEEQGYDYQKILDKLERRIELTRLSREEIKEKLIENKTIVKHTPSIRPLIGGMIRDKFGFRIDPFTESLKHHFGIDIAAERGTEVYATAAGVVEKVVTKWKLGRGYGKQVLINHGINFKTRYGHLSKILVRPGQKVDRWTPIGLIGDTGRATGPHLHYEVIEEGKEKDPLVFILN